MKCEICGTDRMSGNRLIKDFMSLSKHVRMFHKMLSQTYYDKYHKKENEGKCLICKNETMYCDLKRGYCLTCSVSCSNAFT